MKNFRSLLIALCALALIACGDDTVDLGPGDPDSGVEDDASTQPPPDEEEDEEGRFELSFRVFDEQNRPYTGANVRVLGSSSSTGMVDDTGRVTLKVRDEGDHIVKVEAMGDDWSLVYPILRGSTEDDDGEVLVVPTAAFMTSLAELMGLTLSEHTGLVFFVWDLATLGGQSVFLGSGEPFLRIPDEDTEEDESPFRPGSSLTPDVEPVVVYWGVTPGLMQPEYSSPSPDEKCDHILAPLGGWESIERTLIYVPVRCD